MTGPPSEQDRRRFPRRADPFRTLIRPFGAHRPPGRGRPPRWPRLVPATTLDLSLGGLALACMDAYPAGLEMEVWIRVPELGKRPLVAAARVVHHRRLPSEQALHGLAFLGGTFEGDALALAHWLRHAATAR